MVDRTDIDALLIGALYGELTPADEARLAAHLESHPVDRTALDDLTRTRAAVRESRILAFQLEPPPAVSAILLQEASRRAPRTAAPRSQDPEREGWFQRFMRAFAAHPAMAAAATIVLVLGVAGTLYLRGVPQYAAMKAPSDADRAAPAVAPASPPASTTTGAAPAAPADPGAVGGEPRVDDRAAGSGAAAGYAGGSDGYRVDLDEAGGASGAPGATGRQAAANGKQDQIARDDEATRAYKPKAGGRIAGADKDTVRAEPTKLEELGKSERKIRGIELRTPQPSPRELEDTNAKPLVAKSETTRERIATASEKDRARAAPAGGAPPASAAPAPAAPAPAASSGAGHAGPAAASQALEPAPAQMPRDTRPPAAKTAAKGRFAAPPPAPDSGTTVARERGADKSAGTGDAVVADEKAARDRAVLAWARKQHDQVIALVTSNKCREAAGAAVEIYNRAPDYYAANVVTDRQIKPCLAYVNYQRERVDRSRAAAKSAADVQAPQAAPVRK